MRIPDCLEHNTTSNVRWMPRHLAFCPNLISDLDSQLLYYKGKQTNHKIMANIKKMEMAQTIFANENISVEKTFFGLKTKLTYKPTGGAVKAEEYDFTPDMGERMLKIIKTPANKLATAIHDAGKIATTPIGHFHLEACMSEDGLWAAMQMFRFTDFKYQPETEVIYFDGENAQKIIGLL